MRGSINSRIGNDEQALEDLVAADQITPIVAVNTCDRLEDTLNESGASQSRMAKLTALRHSIHTRLQDVAKEPASAVDKEPLSTSPPGCGGCETESSELSVAFEQLAKQGRFSQLRSTTVRIMALFAAVHCFETQNQELVKFRQECFLILKQQLALCMDHLGLSPPPFDAREWPLYGHPADESLYIEQLEIRTSTAMDKPINKAKHHLMTGNMMSGEDFLESMEFDAAADPGNPRVQKNANLCAALKRCKMSSSRVTQ
ncbi:hypothetical protein WJX82_003326 [Trebouxia sp. C0006]